jgi:hypothetical protein
VSLFEFPITFLGGSSGIAETMIFFFTSLVAGVHPPDCWEKIPPGANGQLDLEKEFALPASQGEGLGCTTEPSEAQEPMREGEHLLPGW